MISQEASLYFCVTLMARPRCISGYRIDGRSETDRPVRDAIRLYQQKNTIERRLAQGESENEGKMRARERVVSTDSKPLDRGLSHSTLRRFAFLLSLSLFARYSMVNFRLKRKRKRTSGRKTNQEFELCNDSYLSFDISDVDAVYL